MVIIQDGKFSFINRYIELKTQNSQHFLFPGK